VSFEEDYEARSRPDGPPPGAWSLEQALFGLDAPRYEAPSLHPGRRGWPREHFEAVAQAYNEIIARNPRSPMRELAAQQYRSVAQVRRWVERAEELGITVNRPRRQRGRSQEETS
jgi:hypothetical protein